MIYTDLTKIALRCCFNAHKDQCDKQGVPYVFHPYHVAEQMDDEIAVCVALLHDVMEDTDMTESDLRAAGFPDEVIEPLRLLTHEPGVPYMDYVQRIAENNVATRVKLADLQHNSDITRLDRVTEKDLERVRKYSKAAEFLTQRLADASSSR